MRNVIFSSVNEILRFFISFNQTLILINSWLQPGFHIRMIFENLAVSYWAGRSAVFALNDWLQILYNLAADENYKAAKRDLMTYHGYKALITNVKFFHYLIIVRNMNSEKICCQINIHYIVLTKKYNFIINGTLPGMLPCITIQNFILFAT